MRCGKPPLSCNGKEILRLHQIEVRFLDSPARVQVATLLARAIVFVVSKKPKKFIALCDLRDYDTQNQFYAARGRQPLHNSPARMRSWDCVELMIDCVLLLSPIISVARHRSLLSRPEACGRGSVLTRWISVLPVTGLTALNSAM